MSAPPAPQHWSGARGGGRRGRGRERQGEKEGKLKLELLSLDLDSYGEFADPGSRIRIIFHTDPHYWFGGREKDLTCSEYLS